MVFCLGSGAQRLWSLLNGGFIGVNLTLMMGCRPSEGYFGNLALKLSYLRQLEKQTNLPNPRCI